MKRLVGRAICTTLLAAGLSGFSPTQAQMYAMPAEEGGQFYALNAYMSYITKQMEEMRKREMNVERQKHLERTTDRLVDLATGLNRDMRDKELAPMDLSRRAAEIEKLAHSVQERMRGYV